MIVTGCEGRRREGGEVEGEEDFHVFAGLGIFNLKPSECELADEALFTDSIEK